MNEPVKQFSMFGKWRAILTTPGGELPFGFLIVQNADKYSVIISNGDERISIEDVVIDNDTISVKFSVFNSEINAALDPNGDLDGFWYNYSKGDYKLPFHAKVSKDRFPVDKEPKEDLTGRWDVTFTAKQDTTKSIAEFDQVGKLLTGTFLTSTGDYRYLEGVVNGDQLYLSCFDGAHAFLFKATITPNGELNGEFWSGDHWYETWFANRNESIELEDPYELTYIKDGVKFDFEFPDTDSNMVSMSDFQGKVLLVQIMGTWCPNCKDETEFLSEYYKANKSDDFDIVALAFEKEKEFERASWNVERMKKKLQVGYPVLIAGTSSKKLASGVLPMLNRVMAYPTTIFIDKNGEVRKIHTGFNGPATGERYKELIDQFDTFISELRSE